jgi:uroporphyrinogen-III synthase
MSSARPLAGIGVLVTRPQAQSASLLSNLADLGAEPLLFPALAVVGLAENTFQFETSSRLLQQMHQYDWVIFVSANAVQFGLVARQAAAASINAVAVGNGTAHALHAAGCEQVLTPSGGADSEHLLAIPALQALAGQRVLIVRGVGGRELMADTLRARGAQVDYAECYQRVCPPTELAPLLAALHAGAIDAVTVMSGETLDNLLTLLADEVGAQKAEAQKADAHIRTLPLFVPHARIAQRAQEKNFAQVIVTESGEPGLLAGLVKYFQHG